MTLIKQLLEVVRIWMLKVRCQWNSSHLLLKSWSLESLELSMRHLRHHTFMINKLVVLWNLTLHNSSLVPSLLNLVSLLHCQVTIHFYLILMLIFISDVIILWWFLISIALLKHRVVDLRLPHLLCPCWRTLASSMNFNLNIISSIDLDCILHFILIAFSYLERLLMRWGLLLVLLVRMNCIVHSTLFLWIHLQSFLLGCELRINHSLALIRNNFARVLPLYRFIFILKVRKKHVLPKVVNV